MEILHAFGIEWKLLAIQALNFSVALFVLYRYAYKPIFAIIEKRQHLIAEGVASAEKAKAEEEKIAREKDGILLSARAEGGKIADDLRKEGLETERKIIHEAHEKSTAMIAEAIKHAEEERSYMLRETEKEIARAGVLAAEKILRAGIVHH